METAARTNGIDATYYLAKDLERAVAFYRNNLGLEPTTRFAITGSVEYVLENGTVFGLSTMPDGSWIQSGGVMFNVPDAKSAAAKLRANGVSLFGETMESPVCWMQWCADSEGNTFAVHQRKDAG